MNATSRLWGCQSSIDVLCNVITLWDRIDTKQHPQWESEAHGTIFQRSPEQNISIRIRSTMFFSNIYLFVSCLSPPNQPSSTSLIGLLPTIFFQRESHFFFFQVNIDCHDSLRYKIEVNFFSNMSAQSFLFFSLEEQHTYVNVPVRWPLIDSCDLLQGLFWQIWKCYR
jgi:hypothetical protein